MTKRARVLLAVFVGALLAFWIVAGCVAVRPADAMPLPGSEVHVPIRDSIDYQARYVAPTTWRWHKSWELYNGIGPLGTPAYTIVAEHNRAKTRITGLSILCGNEGGYYAFDGCDKQHTAVGGFQVEGYVNWHYHWFDVLGMRLEKHPTLKWTIDAAGNLSGTLYYRTLP